MTISKITRNFQITLPRDVREQKNLKVGDMVVFEVEDDRVGIVKLEKDILSQTAGLWSGSQETGQSYQRRLRKGWEKRRAP